jgi:glycerol-3-phosphate cytidylyltransferase
MLLRTPQEMIRLPQGGGKMKIGYTTGVYDLFHIGHLNLLKSARGLCDRLVVGVTTDALVAYKNKTPVIPFDERIEIVRCVKYVDVAIPQDNIDKFEAWKKLRFDVLFVGDDWFNQPTWKEMETKFAEVGVRVVYFPYTKGTSSTLINETLTKMRDTVSPSRKKVA